MRPLVILALVWLLIFVACGDDPTAPGDRPGISFPVGTNVSDTIDSTPVQAVRVQVRGPDGRVAANAVVRVEAVRDSLLRYEMLAAGLDARLYDTFLADTTDGEGVINFRVRMGRKAGTGRLLVTVPTLGLQDTAFSHLHGQPGRIRPYPGRDHGRRQRMVWVDDSCLAEYHGNHLFGRGAELPPAAPGE